mgnify:CR=1 FL=1
MPNKPELIIELNDSAIGTLQFDDPVSGTNKNGQWNMYAIEVNGVQMVHFASENAHKTLQNFKKGDTVCIEHVPRSEGGSVYIAKLVGDSTLQDQKSVPINKDNKDSQIKWGMAFNNATRIVANISDITPGQKVILIEEIINDLYKIACSMPGEKSKDDNDLPF